MLLCSPHCVLISLALRWTAAATKLTQWSTRVKCAKLATKCSLLLLRPRYATDARRYTSCWMAKLMLLAPTVRLELGSHIALREGDMGLVVSTAIMAPQ